MIYSRRSRRTSHRLPGPEAALSPAPPWSATRGGSKSTRFSATRGDLTIAYPQNATGKLPLVRPRFPLLAKRFHVAIDIHLLQLLDAVFHRISRIFVLVAE